MHLTRLQVLAVLINTYPDQVINYVKDDNLLRHQLIVTLISNNNCNNDTKCENECKLNFNSPSLSTIIVI